MPACKKTPSRNLEPGQSGQILPLGLALLLCSSLGLLLFINLGRVVVVRERHRMQVDLTADAGAVDMARCLNVAADLNKAQLALFALLSVLETPAGAWLSHIETSKDIDAGVKVADFLPEATVAYVGLMNGLAPIPVWSHGSEGDPSPIPSLNLQRRYADDLKKAMAMLVDWHKGDALPPAPGADPTSSPQDGSRYSYKRKSDGQVISVDPSQVQKVIILENGRLRSQSRKRDPLSGKVKFIKDNGGGILFPLDLVETGPHRVTVLGYASNDDLFDSRLFPRPPAQWVIASAEAGGGDVRAMAIDPNADFDAYLIPVERGLALGSKFDLALDLAHWLRTLGIQVPDDVAGWALIEH